MKKQTFSIVSVLFAICFFISSCASIVSDSDYPVTISSSPERANITIYNEDGLKIFVGKTPATLSLKAGESYFDGLDYTVRFEKEGYETQTIIISSKLDGWYFGNILFGGLIGLLIVDPLTGAMWTLKPHYFANLSEKTSLLEEGEKSINFVLLDDVPKHLRSEMKRIK